MPKNEAQTFYSVLICLPIDTNDLSVFGHHFVKPSSTVSLKQGVDITRFIGESQAINQVLSIDFKAHLSNRHGVFLAARDTDVEQIVFGDISNFICRHFTTADILSEMHLNSSE